MSSKWTPQSQQRLVETLIAKFGEEVSRRNIEETAVNLGLPYPRFIIGNTAFKSGRGMYNLESLNQSLTQPAAPVPETAPALAAQVVPLVRQKKLETQVDNLVPVRDAQFVPFGFYRDLRKIIDSQIFYPVFITGLSGNGKTTMVEQVCAQSKRECVRVNISIETDEDDLIGGNTLVDGNIVYREGPVLMAMRRGAILLIDECDRGSNKLMCMQSIMEGKPYLNKKTGEVVHPAPGFNIIATANTKGQGTEDGRFIAAQIIDEAFLERFAITVEQEFPNSSVEKKIVINKMTELGCLDEDFATKLVTWGDIIRKTYADGGVDELISTRRLLHIVKAFYMFNNRLKAIDLCISRFNEETKTAFKDLYTKVDVKSEDAATEAPAIVTQPNEEVPF